MSNEEEIDQLVAFGLNKIDGPSWIAPPKPQSYLTCHGCKHFHKDMASSGGLRGSPTYFKYCTHSDIVIASSGRRNLDIGFRGSKGGSKDVTPTWCPLYPKETEDILDDDGI